MNDKIDPYVSEFVEKFHQNMSSGISVYKSYPFKQKFQFTLNNLVTFVVLENKVLDFDFQEKYFEKVSKLDGDDLLKFFHQFVIVNKNT